MHSSNVYVGLAQLSDKVGTAKSCDRVYHIADHANFVKGLLRGFYFRDYHMHTSKLAMLRTNYPQLTSMESTVHTSCA